MATRGALTTLTALATSAAFSDVVIFADRRSFVRVNEPRLKYSTEG